jgi:hypothetical protein
VKCVGGDGYRLTHDGCHLAIDSQTLGLGEDSGSGDACPADLQLGRETVALPIALDGGVQLIHVRASQGDVRSFE